MNRCMTRFFAGLILLSLGACQPKEKALTMGISYWTTEIPTLNSIVRGAQERAEELGFHVQTAQAQMDTAQQIANIENLIQLGVDILLIAPVDSVSIVPALEAANRAGVKVVMLDIDAKGGRREAHVTSDNEAMGQYGAEYLAWKLEGKGKVALLDYPFLDIVKERSDAFKEVMKNFPEIQIVATEHAVTRSQGLEKMETILQAHADLDGVYAINDGGGLGAYFAAKALGRHDLYIASVDGEPEAIELIRAGTSFGLDTSHFARILGRTASDVAHAALQGKEVQEEVVIPVFPVTTESLEEFPGRDASELPLPEKLVPPWYKTKSWEELVAKYNYQRWRDTYGRLNADGKAGEPRNPHLSEEGP